VKDTRCPSDLLDVLTNGGEKNDTLLWTSAGEAQSTPDGRFLVFSSFGQLLRGDTDTAKDVYRYDAETGALDRVSLGEAGHDVNGNDNRFDATIPPTGIAPTGIGASRFRAISEDGSRIVFMSSGPLSEAVSNHFGNVYEWHKEPGGGEGQVSLISSGSSLTPDQGAVISASGRDIFFGTSQGLVPQDTDGENDIYDARLEGGFPPSPTTRQPCSSDACQGPLTTPAPLLVPGSVSQVPGDNFAAPATTVKPRARTTAKCPKRKRPGHRRCAKTRANRKTKSRTSTGNRHSRQRNR
jgi:WD40-like Beta Propeller Repeat